MRSRTMHRDDRRLGPETRRGGGCKEFVTHLHDQGLSRDDAIVAVSRAFGVPRGAARLFVLSHPAWSEDGPGDIADCWN